MMCETILLLMQVDSCFFCLTHDVFAPSTWVFFRDHRGLRQTWQAAASLLSILPEWIKQIGYPKNGMKPDMKCIETVFPIWNIALISPHFIGKPLPSIWLLKDDLEGHGCPEIDRDGSCKWPETTGAPKAQELRIVDLVGGLEHFFSIYWEESSQLTFIFFKEFETTSQRLWSIDFVAKIREIQKADLPVNLA